MFRNMRRSKQQLAPEETLRLLQESTSGVLAVLGDGGYPYAVPLSYFYQAGKLFFHCALEGHKLDAIRHNPKASFCVVAQDQVIPKEYTTYYKSVIAFGSIRVLEDAREKQTAIEALALRFYPADTPAHRETFLRQYDRALCMLEFTIEHITGKAAKELTTER